MTRSAYLPSRVRMLSALICGSMSTRVHTMTYTMKAAMSIIRMVLSRVVIRAAHRPVRPMLRRDHVRDQDGHIRQHQEQRQPGDGLNMVDVKGFNIPRCVFPEQQHQNHQAQAGQFIYHNGDDHPAEHLFPGGNRQREFQQGAVMPQPAKALVHRQHDAGRKEYAAQHAAS